MKKNPPPKGLITLYTHDVWTVCYEIPKACFRFYYLSQVLASVFDFDQLAAAFAWTKELDRSDGLYCDDGNEAGIAIRIEEGELWISSINVDCEASGDDMDAIWCIPLSELDRLTQALFL